MDKIFITNGIITNQILRTAQPTPPHMNPDGSPKLPEQIAGLPNQNITPQNQVTPTAMPNANPKSEKETEELTMVMNNLSTQINIINGILTTKRHLLDPVVVGILQRAVDGMAPFIRADTSPKDMQGRKVMTAPPPASKLRGKVKPITEQPNQKA